MLQSSFGLPQKSRFAANRVGIIEVVTMQCAADYLGETVVVSLLDRRPHCQRVGDRDVDVTTRAERVVRAVAHFRGRIEFAEHRFFGDQVDGPAGRSLAELSSLRAA